MTQVFINHDVGWVLYSSGRLVDGGVFGRDIIAANPPLIWWISAIPNAVAQTLGMEPLWVFRIAVFALAFIVLVDLYRNIEGQFSALSVAATLLVFAIFVGVGANRDFGQREHLAILLCLPYLLRAGRLAEATENRTRPNWLPAVAAGIGVAFKPYFVLLPIFVELFIALKRRSARQLLRADVLISTATILLYLVAVFLFARPYITEVIPSVSEVYWGFGWPISYVIRSNVEIVALVGMALALTAAKKFPGQATTLALAAAAFLGAALLQKKGYSYHLYPAAVFALMSLCMMIDAPLRSLKAVTAISLAAALLFLGQMAIVENIKRSAKGSEGARIQAVIDTVQSVVPEGGNYLAISTHPFPGFPVANYSGRAWLAATNSRIGLPAIVRMRSGGMTTAQSDLLARVEARERDAMLKDLSQKPDLILIDVSKRRHAIGFSEFDFLSFYLEDPAFREIWDGYEELKTGLSDFRSFKRK